MSKLIVDDWVDEFAEGPLCGSSADAWANAYDEFLNEKNAGKQTSGVYVFSDMNPYVGHPEPMKERQELFRKGLLREAALALEPERRSQTPPWETPPSEWSLTPPQTIWETATSSSPTPPRSTMPTPPWETASSASLSEPTPTPVFPSMLPLPPSTNPINRWICWAAVVCAIFLVLVITCVIATLIIFKGFKPRTPVFDIYAATLTNMEFNLSRPYNFVMPVNQISILDCASIDA